jgi:HSP20 family molecular chaperone IbpA
MPICSIYLENGEAWRPEQARDREAMRVFQGLFGANAASTSTDERNLESSPEFEVTQARESFLLKAALPGIKLAQIDVRVTAQLLMVSGKRASSAAAEALAVDRAHERQLGNFKKTFVLPPAVDSRRLKVDVIDGVLTIKLPKRATLPATRVARRSL